MISFFENQFKKGGTIVSKSYLTVENITVIVLSLTIVFGPAALVIVVAKAFVPMSGLFNTVVPMAAASYIFLRYREKIVGGVTHFKNGSVVEVVRLLWKGRLSRGAMIYIAFFFSLGVLSFIWTPYDYRVLDLDAIREGPSWEHWFGTDRLGRDMFTRVLFAARITNILVLMTIFVGGLPLSIFLGVVSGYYGGKIDWFIMRFGELFIAVPTLLFILLLTATARPLYDSFLFDLGSVGEWSIRTGVADLMLIFVATSLIFWVSPARLYRSQVLPLRNAPFVEGGRMLGASDKRLISKYILPQLYPFIAHATLLMVVGVLGTEIALSFFGIGISPPHPSFGQMFSESASTQVASSSPHLLVIPGAIVGFFLLSVLLIELRLTVILASVYERTER